MQQFNYLLFQHLMEVNIYVGFLITIGGSLH